MPHHNDYDNTDGPDFGSVGDDPDYRKVKEIAEIADELLSEKEIDFIQKLLTEWMGEFTDAQRNWLNRIYNKVCQAPESPTARWHDENG